MRFRIALLGLLLLAACESPVSRDSASSFDVLIRSGLVIDGTGAEGHVTDVGIRGDRIAMIGDLSGATAARVIDAEGQVVAPGFINVLSWATESLIADGRSLGDIRQGVTLEVFGEGWSMGPWNEGMKSEARDSQGDIRYEIPWTTLGEYLEHLVDRGISPNVASFVGATTVRIHEIGYEDRPPTEDELTRMQALVRRAMEDGALGVGSSLIYAPAFYSSTEELIALCQVAAEYDGLYISHLRSEGNRFLEAIDELIRIARESDIRAEIYHLKAAGKDNWDKLTAAFSKVEEARSAGLAITADMYTYTAGATGLDAAMPPWVQEGGYDAWAARLRDPEIRARLRTEITTPTDEWENLFLSAGSADKILLIGFRNEALKPLTGKTLAQVAAERGTSVVDTMMDLVIEDGSRVGCAYFLMSEDNVRRKIQQPWVSFGSDAGSMAPEGVFLKSSTHPRAYGNFARLLGRYVRDEGLITLPEAIHRLTGLPAENLRLRDRGLLAPNHYADVVVFDPAEIRDHATFEKPHQLATGVSHVLVNGTLVLEGGEHSGAAPGRVVRGPGWSGWKDSHP